MRLSLKSKLSSINPENLLRKRKKIHKLKFIV